MVKQQPLLTLLQETNKKDYIDYIAKNTDAKPESYLGIIDRLSKRIKELYPEFTHLYDYSTVEKLQRYYDAFMNDKEGKKYLNKRSNNAYTTPFNHYMNMLKLRNNNTIIGYNKILFGAPGAGKSFKIDDEIIKNCPYARTTFHPDTDYASFVGCHKPMMKNHAIEYGFVPQVFLKEYLKAWADIDLHTHHFFIIEEINRGNCAQIFGDIFQLLDRRQDGFSGYLIKADEDISLFMQEEASLKIPNFNYKKYVDTLKSVYKSEREQTLLNGNETYLALPNNMSIIATMNTSDQSLFPMDSAFKRRWDWEYIPNKNTDENKFIITIDKEHKYSWHNFRDAINNKIKEATDSEDKQLGSFFIKSNIDKDQFKSKVMFFLWSEIFKEEYKSSKNHFRSNKTQENQPDKDNSKEEYHEFTFNELYEENDVDLLTGFMEYLKVKTVAEEEQKKEKTDNNSNN